MSSVQTQPGAGTGATGTGAPVTLLPLELVDKAIGDSNFSSKFHH